MIPSIWRTMTFLAALTTVLPAKAADSWIATHVRGSVFVLVDNQWRELRKGDKVADDVVVRTLQAGRAELARPGELMQLDPNTAIRPNDSGTEQSVQQYAGVVTMIEPTNGRDQLMTPAFIAKVSGATLISHVAGQDATISVRSGRVELSVAGSLVVVIAGQSFSNSASAAAPPTVSRRDAEGAADGGSSETPDGPVSSTLRGQGTFDDGPGKTDNGAGNAGVPGNGGQNENAGGNGKGTGNESGNSKK